ncbi:hypothetical protein PVAND_008529 [Polypedilum vanderplanki]|uniref:Uncharacterized protein n=1 Tax=Polypedilum vanderplanki TaxID=319348 RepID=A0A9J6C9W2_POLVA|nr:hypothetical protein PVAND_008529 [Polypedilum vanderplanki]
MDLFTKKSSEIGYFYQDMPSANQLHEDFMDFMKNRPEFNSLIKIGKSYIHSKDNSSGVVSLRYSWRDQYEILKANNVFAECASEELALKIERELQNMAIKLNIMIPGSDMTEGPLSNQQDYRFIVYITKLKPIEDRCLRCEKYYSQGKKSHMLSIIWVLFGMARLQAEAG